MLFYGTTVLRSFTSLVIRESQMFSDLKSSGLNKCHLLTWNHNIRNTFISQIMTHPIGVGNSLSTRPVYNSKWMQVLYQYHSAALACDVVTGSFEVQKTFGIRRLRARWDFCVQLCCETALPGNETVVGVNFNSTPEGRAAEGGTPEGRAVSVTREWDLSLLCRIWLLGRHLVSLAKIAEVWPPFFLAPETPDIALEYTSREIWSE